MFVYVYRYLLRELLTSILNVIIIEILQDIDNFERELKSIRSGFEEEQQLRKVEQRKAKYGVIDITFGFKKEIITILGNLGYRHKPNQDEVSSTIK
jgi:hypothetical protein